MYMYIDRYFFTFMYKIDVQLNDKLRMRRRRSEYRSTHYTLKILSFNEFLFQILFNQLFSILYFESIGDSVLLNYSFLFLFIDSFNGEKFSNKIRKLVKIP